MTTLTQRVGLLQAVCCPARQEGGTRPETQSLAQRYQQASWHDRLNLWLQFREARPEFDELEALHPARTRRPGHRLLRLLGLPTL